MRVIFSVVPVRISTSFAKCLNLPSHEKVRSTIKRTGKTAKVSLPELKISQVSVMPEQLRASEIYSVRGSGDNITH